jgi:hypothetical protein
MGSAMIRSSDNSTTYVGFVGEATFSTLSNFWNDRESSLTKPLGEEPRRVSVSHREAYTLSFPRGVDPETTATPK